MTSKKKTSSEVEKIQSIMGKGNKPKQDQNLAHFNADEKCTAIHNWKNNSEVNFDMSFVDSVHSYYQRTGKCSDKQTAALDKIIIKFKIDVTQWSY